MCALINAFGSRPVSDIHSGSEMTFRTLEAFKESNDVQMRLLKIVAARSVWVKYETKMLPLPELDEENLRNLCFGMKPSFVIKILMVSAGSYEVKHAISYIKEHLTPSMFNDDELEFVIELCSKYDNLV